MQPININERRNTFWNFLLLFILCIAIILILVFFSVRVPFSENNKLRSKMELIDKERAFSEEFTRKMIHVSRMLDSVNKISPQEAVLVDGKISDEIRSLDRLVTDTVYNSALFKHVVHNLWDIQKYSIKVRKETESDIDVNNYKSQLEKADEKNKELYAKYIECLASSAANKKN